MVREGFTEKEAFELRFGAGEGVGAAWEGDPGRGWLVQRPYGVD